MVFLTVALQPMSFERSLKVRGEADLIRFRYLFLAVKIVSRLQSQILFFNYKATRCLHLYGSTI